MTISLDLAVSSIVPLSSTAMIMHHSVFYIINEEFYLDKFHYGNIISTMNTVL